MSTTRGQQYHFNWSSSKAPLQRTISEANTDSNIPKKPQNTPFTHIPCEEFQIYAPFITDYFSAGETPNGYNLLTGEIQEGFRRRKRMRTQWVLAILSWLVMRGSGLCQLMALKFDFRLPRSPNRELKLPSCLNPDLSPRLLAVRF